jgi:hypothetical protein
VDWHNAQSVETRIKRLSKEIEEIDKYVYRSHEGEDRVVYAGMLEHKRDDMVRSTVLQVHTSIEDLLTKLLLYCIMDVTEIGQKSRLRTKRAAAIEELISSAGGIGFDRKLTLAVGVGLISAETRSKLRELNRLRNKCSHNWILNALVKRGRRPDQKKMPLLSFRNKDLHKVPVLKEFLSEYSGIYLRLYARWVAGCHV